MEIQGVLEKLENKVCLENVFFRGFAGSSMIDVQISGIGSSETSKFLVQRLRQSRYDLVLNLGICGSFKKEYPIGSVVNIISETWGDMGAEDPDGFLDLFDLGLLKRDEKPFTGFNLINNGNRYSHFFSHIPVVNGLTVNKAHGRKDTIEKIKSKYNPDVESMEGAAVFSICLSEGINFQCLRSISNFVEPRNRQAWEIESGISSLTNEVNKLIRVIRK